MFKIVCFPFILLGIYLQATAQTDVECVTTDACMSGGQLYPNGSQWTPAGVCVQLTCGENGAISRSECLMYNLLEGCCLTDVNLTQAYPDCCRKPQCPCNNPS